MEEMRGIRFWDRRCLKTVVEACEQMARSAKESLSVAVGRHRQAISHLFHHPRISAEELLQGHVLATASRCEEYIRHTQAGSDNALILVASDTTVFNFTRHHALEGLGPISDDENHAHDRGFLTHSALAMTVEGVPLGLLHQHNWTRDPKDTGKAEHRRELPYADKESHKWLDTERSVERFLSSPVNVLLMQDREADIFDFFAAPRQNNIHLLIRATQPRNVEIGGQTGKLLEAVAAAPVIAHKDATVHARPDREARTAHLTVRMTHLSVCAPHDGENTHALPVPVVVIQAHEEHPPKGGKTKAGKEKVIPISWTLLTTLPDVDAAQAVQLVDYYALRWRIERFHYVLKSGCECEKLQCDTLDALYKALSLYSVVAWRLLWLNYLAREEPDMPAEKILSKDETTLLELIIGTPVITAHDALLAVAKIAGFVSVPSAPLPGVKSLWLGLRKLADMLIGFQLAKRQPVANN